MDPARCARGQGVVVIMALDFHRLFRRPDRKAAVSGAGFGPESLLAAMLTDYELARLELLVADADRPGAPLDTEERLFDFVKLICDQIATKVERGDGVLAWRDPDDPRRPVEPLTPEGIREGFWLDILRLAGAADGPAEAGR